MSAVLALAIFISMLNVIVIASKQPIKDIHRTALEINNLLISSNMEPLFHEKVNAVNMYKEVIFNEVD